MPFIAGANWGTTWFPRVLPLIIRNQNGLCRRGHGVARGTCKMAAIDFGETESYVLDRLYEALRFTIFDGDKDIR